MKMHFGLVLGVLLIQCLTFFAYSDTTRANECFDAPPLLSSVFNVTDLAITSANNQLVAFGYGQSCCKICSSGQACGDSCISRSKRCTKPPGCACQG